MKLASTIIALAWLLAGCGRQPPPESADAQFSRKLPGTWSLETGDNVGHFSSTIAVATNGSYTCNVAVTISNQLKRSDQLQGRIEIKDGFLYDYVRTNSNTNMATPYVLRSKIVRMDEHELVVLNQDLGKEIVFRRKQN